MIMLSPIKILAPMLEALTQQIRLAGKEDEYCSITVQPGTAVAFDFGPESDGCGGIAWVRLVASSPAVGSNGCIMWMTHTIEIGMAGPVPGLDYSSVGGYTLPTDEELFDASSRQSDEMMMMIAALNSVDIDGLTIGDYSPSGPEGGVLGGYFTVTVEPD
jgi:hypothetical protein